MEYIEMMEARLDTLRLEHYNANNRIEKNRLEAEIEEVKFEIKMARRYARRGK